MLVLNMNLKRQRRPNVRLEDIGDIPAALTCGVSQTTKINWGNKIWKHDFFSLKESECNHPFTIMDPDVSPGISTDMQQNGENKNPNSIQFASEFANSDVIDARKPNMYFDTIPQKCRVVKRGRRSTRGKRIDFGNTWKSIIGPESSSEDGKHYEQKEVVGFALSTCVNPCCGNGFNGFSNQETSVTGKEDRANDIYVTISDRQKGGNSNEFWKEGDRHESNNAVSQSFVSGDEIKVGCSTANSVKRWLEEHGFGKYAGVFERHEVDEEALLLLTFEDLKEMGVLSVGPRRKLYTAIKKLRED